MNKKIKEIMPTPPLYVANPKKFIQELRAKSEKESVKLAWERCKNLKEKQ